jgi:5-methylcytosine-specific restriction endonuclease McrBC regulatory subunit McrC
MSKVLTTDNHSCHLSNEQKNDLLPFSGRDIKSLNAERQPGLLVFPRDLKINGDDIGKQEIFHIVGDELMTGNVVGFIGIGDTNLSISSRFCNGNENDYFLHYMLQHVMGLNIVNLETHSHDERIYDFLVYLFPQMLLNALRQGLYKEYCTMRHNDSHVKGIIDIARHSRTNIPFVGNMAYNTREHSYDNDMTELIRHTIEYIRHGYARTILHASDDIDHAVKLIEDATPSFNAKDLRCVIKNNMKPIRIPYYSSYLSLQRLCLLILRHEKLSYGNNKNRIHGIIFDAAWLWEEYLDSVIHSCGFKHPQNRLLKGGIYLFVEPKLHIRYPDFWKDDFILDAKYKKIDLNGEARDDLHQVITYMYIKRAARGGLIYPGSKTDGIPLGRLNGYGGEFLTYSLKIPSGCDSLDSFRIEINKEEEALKLILLKKSEHNGI